MPPSQAAEQRVSEDTDDRGIFSRDLACLGGADLILRSAYQMGKTPVLPLLAAALGATTAFVGLVVSVSTVTGLVLKPLFGLLSDRLGRRPLLLGAAIVLSVVPWAYLVIERPGELLAVRVVHGLGTAMLGPVSVAYIAGLGRERAAERLGWFAVARSLGYVLGPLAGGALLLAVEPAAVYVPIAVLSSLALLPLLGLSPEPGLAARPKPAAAGGLRAAGALLRDLSAGARLPIVWLTGGVEALMYAALYALKSFLPLEALRLGHSPVWAGAFFAVQEGVHLVVRPWAGRLGDRVGQRRPIALGLLLLAVALVALPQVPARAAMVVAAALLGIGQALVTPTSAALVSLQLPRRNLGAGFGLAGSLRNAGKVAGPVLAGLAIGRFGYGLTMAGFGVLLVPAAAIVVAFGRAFSARAASGRSG